MNTEPTKSANVYRSDMEKIERMMKQKNLGTRAEAIRVCIEFAQAHGVFK